MAVKRGNQTSPLLAGVIPRTKMGVHKVWIVHPLKCDVSQALSATEMFKDRFEAEMFRARMGEGWVVQEADAFGDPDDE